MSAHSINRGRWLVGPGASTGRRLAPSTVIKLAAVGRDRMLLGGLHAWLAGSPDIRLVESAPTVESLSGQALSTDVVLLDTDERDHADLLGEIRRLAQAHTQVLLVGGQLSTDGMTTAYFAGARAYLTKYHDLSVLKTAILYVATAGRPFPADPSSLVPSESGSHRPLLSRRELEVLVGYASGLTMSSVARQIGLAEATAWKYLERIKEKYRHAGRPTYTKLDLVSRAREDGLLKFE